MKIGQLLISLAAISFWKRTPAHRVSYSWSLLWL